MPIRHITSDVGFPAGICQVACRVYGPTRQASVVQNEALTVNLSGLSGFVWRREGLPGGGVVKVSLCRAPGLDSKWTPKQNL